MRDELVSIAGWLARRREEAPVRVEQIAWADAPHWRFVDGALRHQSGGFFSIVGIAMQAPGEPFDGASLAMIDQPEIGLLGFITRRTAAGAQWLLQAKAEPGATGFTQIGPSVQATRSNYLRLHGGAATRYFDIFSPDGGEPDQGSLQSEQGGRFLGKMNRNALIDASGLELEVDGAWRWVPAGRLREALGEDFIINTDARSVIACSDWRWLCDQGEPFAPRQADPEARWRARLYASWQAGEAALQPAMEGLQAAAAQRRVETLRRPLDELEGWIVGDEVIAPVEPDAPYDIACYDVEAADRECANWAQPLLRGRAVQACRLMLADCAGELRGFFSHAREPGFGNRLELGPSWQSDRVNPAGLDAVSARGDLRAALLQSDEGGRFMSSVMRYEIRDLGSIEPGEARRFEAKGAWLNLAQIEAACRQGAMMTNEARTLVSLLLSWA